jgi:hypothetical protein
VRRDYIYPCSDITQIESLTREIEGAVFTVVLSLEEFVMKVDETHDIYADEMMASCQIIHLTVHASKFNLTFNVVVANLVVKKAM